MYFLNEVRGFDAFIHLVFESRFRSIFLRVSQIVNRLPEPTRLTFSTVDLHPCSKST